VPVALLFLAGLAGCVVPGEPVNTAPKDALSYDELLANLDALEGHAGRSLVLPRKPTWSFARGPESGLMWVPFTWGRSRPAPIISFQHGTQIYGECAASRFNPNPLRVRSRLAMAPTTSRGSCSTR
jgi:hypothetical protein